MKRLNIFIHAQFKGNRRHDSDNICSKLYIDALVKAKIIEDDNCLIVQEVKTLATIGHVQDEVIIELEGE